MQPEPRDDEAPRFPVSVKGVVIRAGAVALLRNERDEWELPGGKLEPAESPELCVAREIAEELGLAVEPRALLDSWVYAITPRVRVLIVTYGCRETREAEAVVSHEHKELRWFPLGEVEGLRMPDGYKASIRSWARQLEGAAQRAGAAHDAEEVTLEPATPASAPLLENLLALYMHDLSEVFEVAPDASGRFVYEFLPRYWSEPEQRFAFVIRRGGRAAGFALVTRGSPASSDPEVLDLAEFFVLRGLRRFGVGRRAADLLWRRLPGRWLVRVAERNRAGVPFWEATVRGFTGGAFSQEPFAGKSQTFRVFSFRAP